MSAGAFHSLSAGPYRGGVSERHDDPSLRRSLEQLPSLVAGAEVLHAEGRHRLYKVELAGKAGPLHAAVKAFGRQGALKDWSDRLRGSKASRAARMAGVLRDRGIGTPPPVAWIERWSGSRLAESYFVTEYEPNLTCFRDELIRIYREDPVCEKLIALLQVAADAVRGLHDAGIVHNDLGNQNILLRRRADAAWGDVMFSDLNRARDAGALSPRQRARDLSRIYLPSDLLRVFFEMYFAGVPPSAFRRWQKFYRALFDFHTLTRSLRHPLRSPAPGVPRPPATTYPPEKDIWIWDERSGQAISTMRSRDRMRHYARADHGRIAAGAAAGLLPVLAGYRALASRCFAEPVSMKNRIGIALSPTPENEERELDLLRGLGVLPILLRFYHHESEKDWKLTARVAHRLHEEGFPVSVALVQDRRAALDPASWDAFVEAVLGAVGSFAEWVEVGHAVNRVKWGLWGFDEYARLLDGALRLRGRFPKVRFMGPAMIDFEYHRLAGLLRTLPPSVRFDALSHHLYVDRRGAPENTQAGFSTAGKCALLRAIAQWSGRAEDRVILSEVNWPLENTGVHSPVGSPYLYPGQRLNGPSVSEDVYADYLLRYVALAVCSGMAERVYWWRLVARGYGLVDDAAPGAWRKRPAYDALKFFLSLFGEATFAGRLPAPEGAHALAFDAVGGRRIVMAWSHRGEAVLKPPFPRREILDRRGEKTEVTGPEARLSGSPVYFLPA